MGSSRSRFPLLLSFALVVGVGLLAQCAGVTKISTRPKTPPPIPASWGSFSITRDLIPAGRHGRKRMEPMRPRYITVHSTANTAAGADARTHARGLRNGSFTASHNSLGYVTWHFTVDDRSVYQSLPTTERGEHADYEGLGNKTSIGIEMCENRGSNRVATIDRTAKLVALLMKQYDIPRSHVVPHHHWRRIRYDDGKDLGHKDCPRILMDNGTFGPKWQAFHARIERYYRQL